MTSDRVWTPSPENNPFSPYLPAFMPAGRIQDAPLYLTINVTWTDSKPPDDQLPLFQDILLIRDNIRWHVPSIPFWSVPTVNSPFPRCVYTNVHWLSNTIGVDDNSLNLPTGALGDIRWFLYYGDVSGLQTASFDNLIDQTQLTTSIYSTGDSVGVDSDPTDIDTNEIQQTGWCLYMVKRKLVQDTSSDPIQTINAIILPILGFTINLVTQDPPIVVEHHVYGAWQLVSPPTPPVPFPPQPQYSILDLTVPTEWQIFHNALAFPPHSLVLEPFLA